MIFKKINKKYYIIFIITICIFLPYISHKFIYGDDFPCHISNLISIDQYISIEKFKFFPSRIRPIIGKNLGYGAGIFYPQLAYFVTEYIYIIIKQLGFSLISAIKIYEFIVVLLSGTFMYKFVNENFKNEDISLLAAIMYMLSPYFMCDVFVRMALAEMTIFLFIPIVLLSITYMLQKKYNKFLLYFVIGYCGCILSHLVMTMYFTILIFLILIINIKRIWNKTSIKYFFIGTIIVLGITMSSIVPMLEHKFKGDYVVFNSNEMMSLDLLKRASLNLYGFINRYEKYFRVSYFISISIITMVLITLSNWKIIYNNLDNEKKRWVISIIAFSAASIFISSKFMIWKFTPKILWSIQFPWRMSMFVAFGLSIIASLGIIMIRNKKMVFILVFVVGIMDLTYIIGNVDLENVILPNSETISSLNNGYMGWSREYLPTKANNNLDYYEKREENVVIKNKNNEKIEILKNDVPFLKFKIEIEDNRDVKVEIPRIFYYGYKINYQGEDEKIEYYENENGFIEFEIKKSGTIIVDYKGTLLDKYTNIVSIVTIILFLIFIIIEIKNKHIKKCKLVECSCNKTNNMIV